MEYNQLDPRVQENLKESFSRIARDMNKIDRGMTRLMYLVIGCMSVPVILVLILYVKFNLLAKLLG